MEEPTPLEGSDIRSSDMVVHEDESQVTAFYKDTTIMITGATGYIGKMILEKLLRSCPDLKHIYILVRPKKGKELKERFEAIFEEPLFEPLKRQQPNFQQKVTVVNGDMLLPNLGLSEEDEKRLIQEVNCVFHCAATVRFDEHIKTAVNINIRAVKDILKLAKKMSNLKGMLHVSTAYSNCIRRKIEEVFYEAPYEADNLIALVQCLDDDKLTKITPSILGSYPNTYVLTKAVAESVIRKEGKSLPISIIRPSIIIASAREPVAGWIDNLYGATGVLIGSAMGVLRTLPGKKTNKADMVPSDYVVNSSIVALWDIACKKGVNENEEVQPKAQSDDEKLDKEIPIYNYVCTPETSMTWEIFERLTFHHAIKVPSPLCVWYYYLIFCSNAFSYKLSVLLLHTLPAYIVDFLAILIGKKPRLVKGYQKINKFSDILTYFTTHEWDFRNPNTQALWKRLNKTDQNIFEFSMKLLNWDTYFYTYVRGGRVYLLKDPLDTVEAGKRWYAKLRIIHYALVTALYSLGVYILYKIFAFLFLV